MWKIISVKTTTEGSDFVAAAFFATGAQGVQIVDKNDVLEVMRSGIYWDYVDESLLDGSDAVTVSGFAPADEIESKVNELTEELNSYVGANLGALEITVTDADEENWYENWKKFYRPIEAGRYLVQPKWLKAEAVDKTVILIDPGMAFGSGEHESTKMCLKLMSDHIFDQKTVIDVGTGSGILGIAALLSGAKSAYMCDIDACAVTAAKENASLNGVLDRAVIEHGNLLSGNPDKADFILANLTADILCMLSAETAPYLKEGGRLFASGIITRYRQKVEDSFAAAGLYVTRAECMGDWVALEFTKK